MAAVLYGKITGVGGEETLRVIYSAHQRRTVIKPRLRKLGAPHTGKQKLFVLRELPEPSGSNLGPTSATSSSKEFYDADGPYGFLSNFYKSNILVDGINYPTSEHLYQSLKFNYLGASDQSKKYSKIIASQNTPGKAKILSNQKIRGGY